MTEEKDLTVFHNENAVNRIILWANVIGYILLIFSLFSLVYQFYDLNSNLGGDWSQVGQGFRDDPFQIIAFFVLQVFMEPLKGVFYFLVLRGLSELLNLGLDLFYETQE